MIEDIAPSRLDNHYYPDALPDGDSAAVLFRGGNITVRKAPCEEGVFPSVRELSATDGLRYIFSVDGRKWFLDLSGKAKPKEPEGFGSASFRELRRRADVAPAELLAASTAAHLREWYSVNVYCGRCAAKTEHSRTERALVCPSCGNVIYPKLLPAVIVGVIDRENRKMLITRYNRPGSYNALVAGFTEIGETLEQTAEREVFEETGIRIKNIRYYRSQPWGIAGDILAGFFCEPDGSREIRVDRSELSSALWLSPEETELQPDSLSLTNNMMTLFKTGGYKDHFGGNG